jgi:hypothetical protein
MADVVEEVEAVVVDPDRVLLVGTYSGAAV